MTASGSSPKAPAGAKGSHSNTRPIGMITIHKDQEEQRWRPLVGLFGRSGYRTRVGKMTIGKPIHCNRRCNEYAVWLCNRRCTQLSR